MKLKVGRTYSCSYLLERIFPFNCFQFYLSINYSNACVLMDEKGWDSMSWSNRVLPLSNINMINKYGFKESLGSNMTVYLDYVVHQVHCLYTISFRLGILYTRILSNCANWSMPSVYSDWSVWCKSIQAQEETKLVHYLIWLG